MRHVAITGLGLVSALGDDLAAAWPRRIAGAPGIARISRFDPTGSPVQLAAQVPDRQLAADPAWSERARRARFGTRLFIRACAEAASQARLADRFHAPARIGVVGGASVNYLHLGRLRDAWRCRDADGTFDPGQYDIDSHPAEDFARRQGDEFAAAAAEVLGAQGPRAVIDTACASSAHAIAEGARLIRRGQADVVVAGGGCALVQPIGLLAFARIGALTTGADPARASRPFDRDRNGFVMGEAGAALVLENLEAAHRRGAPVLAELAGWGSTTTAASLTDPSADGRVEGPAMSLALIDAGIGPDVVDYVAAHGTSTPRNDATETLAIKHALGARAAKVAVSSCKGQLGHTLAAAGACNVVLAAMAVARGEVPPTTGYHTPDPACDLDYVPGRGRRMAVHVALANAFAFGGHNVSIALRAPDWSTS
jgi:3-oxoacyl-(acyl-carrier-protein) synthase